MDVNLKNEITTFLVNNTGTAFVGRFQDDMAADIFDENLASDIKDVSWIEFRYDGKIYQMYLTEV